MANFAERARVGEECSRCGKPLPVGHLVKRDGDGCHHPRCEVALTVSAAFVLNPALADAVRTVLAQRAVEPGQPVAAPPRCDTISWPRPVPLPIAVPPDTIVARHSPPPPATAAVAHYPEDTPGG